LKANALEFITAARRNNQFGAARIQRINQRFTNSGTCPRYPDGFAFEISIQ
jgi:hypothetical protein